MRQPAAVIRALGCNCRLVGAGGGDGGACLQRGPLCCLAPWRRRRRLSLLAARGAGRCMPADPAADQICSPFRSMLCSCRPGRAGSGSGAVLGQRHGRSLRPAAPGPAAAAGGAAATALWKQIQQRDWLFGLPPQIADLILARLDVPSLKALRLMCKQTYLQVGGWVAGAPYVANFPHLPLQQLCPVQDAGSCIRPPKWQ